MPCTGNGGGRGTAEYEELEAVVRDPDVGVEGSGRCGIEVWARAKFLTTKRAPSQYLRNGGCGGVVTQGGRRGGNGAVSSGQLASAFWCILGIHIITQFDTRLRLRLSCPFWFQWILFIFLSFLFLFLVDIVPSSLRIVFQKILFPELLDFSSQQLFYLGQMRESLISQVLISLQGSHS